MPGMCEGLCTCCRSSLVPTAGFRCALCGGPVDDPTESCISCVTEPVPQKGTVVWGEYDGMLRDAVLALKHQGHDQIGAVLAGRLAARVSLEPWAQDISMVTAIPSHPLHRLRRGFSAAEILGRVVARSLRRPYQTTLRRHGIRRQTSRSRAQRKQMLQRRFSTRSSAKLQGQTILLIDDVITTGTTLKRAVHALKHGGASEIYTGALAFTPDPRSMG